MSMAEEILRLKEERNAIILAHSYQTGDIQDMADYVGDSLGLAYKAQNTDCDVIAFCGVHFMAETAKILSPEKTVLLPEKAAGCLMADMIDADQLRALKAEHPGAKVLCYVNTSAAVKAECDLCCTSANAVRMVREGLREAAEIIFVPDKAGLLPHPCPHPAGECPRRKGAAPGGGSDRPSRVSPGIAAARRLRHLYRRDVSLR